MAKHLFMLIAMLLTPFSFMSAAESQDSQNVILTKKMSPNGDNHNGSNRAPAAPITIVQDGHELTFTSDLVGFTLMLIHDGEVLYSNLVDPSRYLFIPEEITGMKEIRLVKDDITYWGVILL